MRRTPDDFRRYLEGRGVDPERIERMVAYSLEFDRFLDERGTTIEDADVASLKEYLSELIKDGTNSPERLVAIARYCGLKEKHDLFIHLLLILNSYDILPLIGVRLSELTDKDTKDMVFEGFVIPPLGTPPEEFPDITKDIVDRMEEALPPEKCRQVLTWNYHEIPKESFFAKKERFDASRSIDDYLRGEHMILVEELKRCLKEGKVWFEQEVTQEFIDEVESDQHIQTGVREDDRIISIKVPFDPKHFYKEKDPTMKRYYACHCPLVRTAIRDGRTDISPTFCYCSAGFKKIGWDTIFDEDVEVDVLKSVLGGDGRCMFSVRIPKNKMK